MNLRNSLSLGTTVKVTATNPGSTAAGFNFTVPVYVLLIADGDVHIKVGAAADANSLLLPAHVFFIVALPAGKDIQAITDGGNAFVYMTPVEFS